MTIYVVVQHVDGGTVVLVSAWQTMTEATLDAIKREGPPRMGSSSYTVEVVNLDDHGAGA